MARRKQSPGPGWVVCDLCHGTGKNWLFRCTLCRGIGWLPPGFHRTGNPGK